MFDIFNNNWSEGFTQGPPKDIVFSFQYEPELNKYYYGYIEEIKYDGGEYPSIFIGCTINVKGYMTPVHKNYYIGGKYRASYMSKLLAFLGGADNSLEMLQKLDFTSDRKLVKSMQFLKGALIKCIILPLEENRAYVSLSLMGKYLNNNIIGGK